LPYIKPEELKQAELLMYQGKFNEALEMTNDFAAQKTATSKDQLSSFILKGRIFNYMERYKEAVEIGEIAYHMSQKMEVISELIDSLLIKAHVVFFGKLENSIELILEAENTLNSIFNHQNYEITRQKSDLLLMKSIIHRITGDLNKSLELALQWQTLGEKISEKLDISRNYFNLGEIFLLKGDPKVALDYVKKSLKFQQELNNQIGIASCTSLVGLSHFSKGEFDDALKCCRYCLSIKDVSKRTEITTLHLIGAIYKEKGELNRTLRYYNRAAKLAEQENYYEGYLENIMGIGTVYRMKGEHEVAMRYLKRSLKLCKSIKSLFGINASLFYLVLSNLDIGSFEQAQEYLKQLEEFSEQTESNLFNQSYLIAKALALRKTNRIRNRTEAEMLLKQVVENKYTTPQLYLLTMVNLCDLFLEELFITNNLEVLDELNPLIERIFKVAENQHAYLWLAETKLLQAKLALIQMRIDEAQQYFTQAQQIAEMHGLNLLAIKISSEHDDLLEQLNTWINLEKKKAPMSERIKLASFKGVIDRMQGRSAIETEDLTPETPVLLLIIAEGGVPLFSKQFLAEWAFEDDIISGFLTAFNTFSGELFSNRLDRAKFGDYTILMQPIAAFSVCYLFKGQTYLAKQKLTQFIEKIHNSSSLKQKLIKFSKSNRMIQPGEDDSLESIIFNIFVKNDSLLNY